MNPTYKYTNGVDLLRLLPVLKDRVRWVSEGTSKSGRYFDDGSFHAMVSEAVLRSSQTNKDITDDEFRKLKSRFKEAAIIRAASMVFSVQPSVIDQTALYDSVYSKTTINPGHLFTGYEIYVGQGSEVVRFEKVILAFSQNTPVTLYLYKQDDDTALWQQTVEAIGGKRTVAELTDCYIPSSIAGNTVFYLGYKPSELLNSALPYQDSPERYNSMAVFGVSPIVSDTLQMLHSNISYVGDAYGINFQVSSMSDYTDRLVRMPWILDELIGLVHTSMVLEVIMFNDRHNPKEQVAQSNVVNLGVQMDLMGALPISDSPHTLGLRARIEKQVQYVREAFKQTKTGVASDYGCQ